MDDLISRAVLLKDLSYCAPELWQDEEYIKAKIMKQSTIAAIPVEWLREKMKWADDEGDLDSVDLFSWILQTWQKEQEAQDG